MANYNKYSNGPPIPEDITFNMHPTNDPELPLGQDSYFNDFEMYEKELANILQTPPSTNESRSTKQVRRTPGAEISDQNKKVKRTQEIDSQFQLLQAVKNIKESTEQTQFNSFWEQKRPVEEYSLWGGSSSNAHLESPFSSYVPSRQTNVAPNTYLQRNSNAMVSPFGSMVPSCSNPFFTQDNSRAVDMFHNPYHSSTIQQQQQTQQSGMYSFYNPSHLVPRGPRQANPFPYANLSDSSSFFKDSSCVTPQSAPCLPTPQTVKANTEKQSKHRRQLSSGTLKPPTPSHKRSASTSNEHSTMKPKEANPSRDQVDSPTSNMKFKQFYREFKQKEKEGYEFASQFAVEHLEILPQKVHWRVFLELADLAKRENKIKEARHYYQQVNTLQPTAAQGWLEYAKMEEECGNLEACKVILSDGLSHCTVNESLMVKCLKHFERMNHLQEARALLGALKDVPVERTWRTIMEGGLLEARQGNIAVARQVFHYLISSVPWYGPIYQEACRFEEKCEEHEKAMEFVKLGLQENPRYGPLWFSALRLNEILSKGDVKSVYDTIERAVKSISKELIWKLYFEAAQIEERAGNINESREFYVKSVSHCPSNLLWKVWMGGARTELNYDNIDIARELLRRALEEVPPKMKAMILLECCRLEEYAGKLDKAREILSKAKKYTKHEWKVFLESVLLEMRANNLDRAIQEAKEALTIHTGTGRLWAVMIQLNQLQGIEAQIQVFGTALREVPKSGEVWCEGARIALQRKDYEAARKYINFAIQFTPQYGDSFIEYLRLEILEKGNQANFQAVEQACVNADPNYGALWLHCKENPLDSTRNVIRQATRILTTPTSASDEVPAAVTLMVNDIYQNVHNRSNEERRKAIFL